MSRRPVPISRKPAPPSVESQLDEQKEAFKLLSSDMKEAAVAAESIFGNTDPEIVFGIFDRLPDEEPFKTLALNALKSSLELGRELFGASMTSSDVFEIFDRYVGEDEDEDDE